MQFGFTLKPEHDLARTVGAHAPGRGRRLRLRLAVRLARPVARAVRPADAHGPGHRAPAARHLRDEPGDARADRHRVGAGDARRAERRPDGPRDRAGRLRPARPRQAADDDGHAGGGDHRHPGARRGPGDRVRGHGAPAPVDGQLDAAGLGRRLRPDGPRDDRPRRRRRDPPARRPRPDPLVRRPGPRGRSRRRPADRARSRSRPRRRPTSATASCAASGRAGSRPSSATTSSTSSTSTRASSCRSR